MAAMGKIKSLVFKGVSVDNDESIVALKRILLKNVNEGASSLAKHNPLPGNCKPQEM